MGLIAAFLNAPDARLVPGALNHLPSFVLNLHEGAIRVMKNEHQAVSQVMRRFGKRSIFYDM
jgi:hypothetical protein